MSREYPTNWRGCRVIVTDSSVQRECDQLRYDPAVMLLIDDEPSRTHCLTPDDAERIGMELICAAGRAREAQASWPKDENHD